MIDHVSLFLARYSNEIWMAFLGVLGGSVRVAVGITKKEDMPPSQIFAILVTGATLAGTSSPLFVEWLSLSPEASSFCSFIVGVMGMNVVKRAMDVDIGALVFKQGPKE